jgi:hypothetical protein
MSATGRKNLKVCRRPQPVNLVIRKVPKGSQNKRTKAVDERLEARLRSDEDMARLAMDETVEVGIRAQMFKELAQYLYPKRKAIEVNGEDGEPIQGELALSALHVRLHPTVGPPTERDKDLSLSGTLILALRLP